jgi:hypothetical protein
MKKNRINYGSDGPLKKGNQNLIRLFSTTKKQKNKKAKKQKSNLIQWQKKREE